MAQLGSLLKFLSQAPVNVLARAVVISSLDQQARLHVVITLLK